jgi:hypothetical protein
MRESFAQWQQINTTISCSGVRFQESFDAPPPPASQGNQQLIVYTANPIPGTDATAAGYTNCINSNPNHCQGSTFFNTKCKLWLKYPSNQHVSNEGQYAATFESAVRKVWLHEIGHVLGLGHQLAPYQAGYSIMNNMRGPQANDTGSSQPPVASAGWLPWNPPQPMVPDISGVPCEICNPVPTPTPAPVCHEQLITMDWIYMDDCEWTVYVYGYFCDGVQIDERYEFECMFCHNESQCP